MRLTQRAAPKPRSWSSLDDTRVPPCTSYREFRTLFSCNPRISDDDVPRMYYLAAATNCPIDFSGSVLVGAAWIYTSCINWKIQFINSFNITNTSID